MTTVRNDAVVEAMRQVASNDSVERRTMLFQMLADSSLIVPTAGPRDDGTTPVQLAGGPDGSVLAVFTDLDAFGRWAPPGTACAALEAVGLFRTAVRLGVVRVAVNPGSDPTGELTPREFTSLAEGRVPVGASTDFVQPGTTMQFGRPRVAPSPVGIDAVRRAIHDNGAREAGVLHAAPAGGQRPGHRHRPLLRTGHRSCPGRIHAPGRGGGVGSALERDERLAVPGRRRRDGARARGRLRDP